MCVSAFAAIPAGTYAIKVYGTNKYWSPNGWNVKGNDKVTFITTDRPAWIVMNGATAETNAFTIEGSVQSLNPYHYDQDDVTTVGCWAASGAQSAGNGGDAEWYVSPVENKPGTYTIQSNKSSKYLSYSEDREYVLMTAETITEACYFTFESLTPLLTIGCVSDVHCMNSMITPESGSLDDITVRTSLTKVLNRMKTEDNPDVLVFGGDSESDKTLPEANSQKVRHVLAEAMRGVFQEGKNPNVLWLTGNHDYEVANFPSGRTETDKPYNAGDFYEFPMKQDIGLLSDADLFYEDAENGEYGTERILAAYHYVLNGFDFVVLNCGKYFFRNAWDYTFSTESATWVQNKLAEIDPDGTKTVFFLCHVPFPDSNSINASGNKGMNTTQGYPILKAACAAHPNLIMLYGHDHGQDNAYIREKTSQRVTLYDASGNKIATTDSNHVDGTMPGDAPEGGETSEEMSLDNVYLKSQSGQYFGIDSSNDIVMQDTPYSFTFGEIDGVENAHNFKLTSSSRWINSGTNGLLSTTTTNNDDNVRHFYFYEVTSNNGITITAKQVKAPSATKDYLIGVSNVKSGSNGFFVIYAQPGNSSSVRLDVVRINNSSIVTLSNGKKTVSDIPATITLTASNTDSYSNSIDFNKVLWQFEKEPEEEPEGPEITNGKFYIKANNGKYLTIDSNNLGLGDDTMEFSVAIDSNNKFVFSAQYSGTKYYLHIGGNGRWSRGVNNDTPVLLFDKDGNRVTSIRSKAKYYLVALYNGNYYAMKGEVYSAGNGNQRMATTEVTLNDDQTKMTSSPGADYQWSFTNLLTTGTFYVTHNDQHLIIEDPNNLNLGSTATEHALEAGSVAGTFKLKTSSSNYLHIGGSGLWSDGTASNLLLFDAAGKRVYNIVSGQPYYIVAYYSSNYYAMKSSVYRDSSKQRMDTQAVSLNSDQTQMTTTPGEDFLWTFTDVNATTSNPGTTNSRETSFFSSFMGSLRYYYNTIEGNSTDPADSPKVVQALVVKVYEDRVELHMKNYNETGTINGITIADVPTPYTSFRTVTHSASVEYDKYIPETEPNWEAYSELANELYNLMFEEIDEEPIYGCLGKYSVSNKSAEDATTAIIEYLTGAEMQDESSYANDMADMQDMKSNLVLNMPEPNNFYRFKSFKQSEGKVYPIYLGNYVGIGALAPTASQDNAVFYAKEGASQGQYQLISYKNGQYASIANLTPVGSTDYHTIEQAKSSESEIMTGKYALVGSTLGRRLNIQNTSLTTYITNYSENEAFEIEKVQYLPVTFKAAALGFATFNCPVAVTIPDGVEAYLCKMNGDVLNMYGVDAGTVLPANTPVLLKYLASMNGVDQTVYFEISTSSEEITDNSFYGTVAAEVYDGDYNWYSLQKSTTEEKVGFYNKASGNLGGFKAWLKTSEAQVRNFQIVFEGDEAEGTTAIKQVLGIENHSKMYDISGRAVNNVKRGLFISNGNKVVY